MNTCLTCGVPLVLMRTGEERKIATFKCPACGYVVLVYLGRDVPVHAQARPSNAFPAEAEHEASDYYLSQLKLWRLRNEPDCGLHQPAADSGGKV